LDSTLPIPSLLTAKDYPYENAKRVVLDSLWSEYRRFIETGISMTGYEFGTTSAEYLSQWEGEAVLGQFRKGLVDQHEAEFGSVDFHQLEYEQFRNSLPF